jgi:hypothetical protein
MRCLPILAAILAVTAWAQCARSAEQEGQTPPPIRAIPPRKPVPVPSSAPPEGKLVTAEVPPDLIEKMRADLAQRAGIAASAAKVVRAESIEWPNGALGCAEPGQIYTQAIVPGYVVELEHDGRMYSYHASKAGFFKLCARARGLPPSSAR